MTKKKKRAPFTVPAPIIAVPKPPPASKGPVFTATFKDGTTTRMSIYSAHDPLDLERAIKVSQAAWSSRTKKPMTDAPRIVAALFEDCEGELLIPYNADELNAKKEETV